MDKYDQLEKKLCTIKEYLRVVEVNGNATKSYIVNYERYVDSLIKLVHNRKICNSNGALLGLTRGISDYEELCSCERLWEAVQDADNYYSRVCVNFE